VSTPLECVWGERSLTEQKIIEVWVNVLGLPDRQISVTASFLELGGDSVAAALCRSRLRNTFGPELDADLSDFFDEASTIQNFANGIHLYNSTEPSRCRAAGEAWQHRTA